MHLRFDRGTLVLTPTEPRERPGDLPGVLFDPRACVHRAPGEHYAALLAAARARQWPLEDRVRAKRAGGLDVATPELRGYQELALDAWDIAGRRGLVALPTGAGKTWVALGALARVGRPSVILAPTRALVHQWVAAVSRVYHGPIGMFGDGRRDLGRVTVCTFESALRRMDEIGDLFALLVVDEAHHFGGGARQEALEMCVAPARLGLTATPPDDEAQLDRLRSLVGEVVFTRRVSDLTGEHLARFEHHTIGVDLTPEEGRAYRAAWEPYDQAWRALRRAHPGAVWTELRRSLASCEEGRRLLAGFQEAQRLVAHAAGKLELAQRLLERHRHDRALLFTADNRAAYALSERLLVPAITCDIGRAERDEVLEAFRQGRLRALVSSRVLNEGIDLPDARVAIVLGGRLGSREHIQRVGRVLRPGAGQGADKVAVVYRLVARGTFEESRAAWQERALAA